MVAALHPHARELHPRATEVVPLRALHAGRLGLLKQHLGLVRAALLEQGRPEVQLEEGRRVGHPRRDREVEGVGEGPLGVGVGPDAVQGRPEVGVGPRHEARVPDLVA